MYWHCAIECNVPIICIKLIFSHMIIWSLSFVHVLLQLQCSLIRYTPGGNPSNCHGRNRQSLPRHPFQTTIHQPHHGLHCRNGTYLPLSIPLNSILLLSHIFHLHWIYSRFECQGNVGTCQVELLPLLEEELDVLDPNTNGHVWFDCGTVADTICVCYGDHLEYDFKCGCWEGEAGVNKDRGVMVLGFWVWCVQPRK